MSTSRLPHREQTCLGDGGLGAVPLDHLGRIGLNPVAPCLASYDQPHARHRRVPGCHRRAGFRAVQPRRARRLQRRSATARMQLLFVAAAGVAGLPLSETGVQRRPAGAHLVIVLVVRHMRLSLFRRSGSVDYRNTSASQSTACLPHISDIDNMTNYYNSTLAHYDAILKTRRSSCPGFPSLLAPSEADRPPSEPSLTAPGVCFASY
jgi:hypothetical protein